MWFFSCQASHQSTDDRILSGKDVYEELAKVLFSKGLIESSTPRNPGNGKEDGKVLRGGESPARLQDEGISFYESR